MIEDLPPELWLDFLTYLNIQDRFKSFFNLNKRINDFLLNYHYHINLQGNDADIQYLMEYILPHSKRTSSLRLDKIDSFKNANFLHISHLTSVTFCRLYITNDILDLLKSHASNIEYLNVSLSISSKWNLLLPVILSLPKLQICYLMLGIGLCPIKLSNELASPIKYLNLIGNSRHSCCRKKLISLLNHLPNLKSLDIQCDKLHCDEMIPSNTKSLCLSSFSLKLDHLPYLFTDFIDFISITIPYIQKLKLKCCNPLLNLVYINVYQWKRLIDLLPNLNEIILILIPDKTIKIESWNKRCEQLLEFLHRRFITLRIIPSIEHKN